MFVPHKFIVPQKVVNKINSLKPNFGHNGLGELVYYRTYARKKEDGSLENWNDTILRVVAGTFSILKSHIIKNHLKWDQERWEEYCEGFSEYMFDMKFLPPGRGLWAMGTDVVDIRGSMSLNNCAFVTSKDLVKSTTWITRALMMGVGVGFDTDFQGYITYPKKTKEIVIEDSREGWSESVRELVSAFVSYHKNTKYSNKHHLPIFDYSKIRGPGIPLKTFGGSSSGPEPLIKLHKRLRTYFYTMILHNINVEKFNKDDYDIESDLNKDVLFLLKDLKTIDKEYLEYALHAYKKYSKTQLIVDIYNAIGACIQAGGTRRSSQIAISPPDDDIFLHLKDLSLHPERKDIYWCSNNTIMLRNTEDFKKYIPIIAKKVIDSQVGEPGLGNLLNIKKFGRVNKTRNEDDPYTREFEEDLASGLNPCGEIPLEPFELCCLSECFNSRCVDVDGKFSQDMYYKAMEYATFYASIVSLLPTDSEETNKVIARNHRIGVSLSGVALLAAEIGYSSLIDVLKKGYRGVRTFNKNFMCDMGVSESKRISCVKPSGSISKLVGCPEGIHHPIGGRYIIRRVRINENSDLVPFLIKSNVPYEKDSYADQTLVFSFPIDNGPCRPITEVSMWEQLHTATIFSRFWSDNSTSISIMYDKEEAKDLEKAIALTIGNVKSLSFAPKSDIKYPQAPIEAITYEKYLAMKEMIGVLNFSEYRNSMNNNKDNDAPKFCDGDKCTI